MENIIGSNIKIRLRELKKTQGWLAERIEVSDVAVTKWIRTGKVSRANLAKVAEVLQITTDKMLGNNETVVVENELELRLLQFYRGMSSNHKEDLLSIAGNLHHIDELKADI